MRLLGSMRKRKKEIKWEHCHVLLAGAGLWFYLKNYLKTVLSNIDSILIYRYSPSNNYSSWCCCFIGDNYEQATALVVTFVVRNDKNDTFQTMATEWEKAFLDLIKNHTSENITISYMAEVKYIAISLLIFTYNIHKLLAYLTVYCMILLLIVDCVSSPVLDTILIYFLFKNEKMWFTGSCQ